MTTTEQAIIDYHRRLVPRSDRLFHELSSELARSLARLSAAARETIRSGEVITWSHLQRLRPELISISDDLGERLARRVTQVLQTLLLEPGAPHSQDDDNLLLLGAALLWQGVPWSVRASTIAADLRRRLDLSLRNSVGTRFAGLDTITSGPLRPTGKALAALSGTALQAVANRAWLLSARRSHGDIAGVRSVAVLDDRTTAICQFFHNKVWRIDDPSIDTPPRHPYCRSVLVPVTFREMQ